jgi:hypothetical protein
MAGHGNTLGTTPCHTPLLIVTLKSAATGRRWPPAELKKLGRLCKSSTPKLTISIPSLTFSNPTVGSGLHVYSVSKADLNSHVNSHVGAKDDVVDPLVNHSTLVSNVVFL